MANPWQSFPALQRASEVLARRRLGKTDAVVSESRSVPLHVSTTRADAWAAAAAPSAVDATAREALPTASQLVRPPPPPPQLTFKVAKADAAVATDDILPSCLLHPVEVHGSARDPLAALNTPAAHIDDLHMAGTWAQLADVAAAQPLPLSDAAESSLPLAALTAAAPPAAFDAPSSAPAAVAAARTYPGGISKSNYWHADPFPRGLPLRMVRPALRPHSRPQARQQLHPKSEQRGGGSAGGGRRHGVDSVGYLSSHDDDDEDDDSLWHATTQPTSALSFAERVRRRAAAEALQRKAATAAVARAVVAGGVADAPGAPLAGVRAASVL